MLSACLIGLMLAVLASFGLAYMKLVSLDKTVKTAWIRLDSRLKDRNEFITPVALRAASFQEIQRPFIYHLHSLQNECRNSSGISRRAAYEEEITQKFKKVFSTAQSHPELLKDEQFLRLQTAVARAQTRLSRAKTRYNNAVQDYNTLTQTPPLNFLAHAFEFPRHEYFTHPQDSSQPIYR